MSILQHQMEAIVYLVTEDIAQNSRVWLRYAENKFAGDQIFCSIEGVKSPSAALESLELKLSHCGLLIVFNMKCL